MAGLIVLQYLIVILATLFVVSANGQIGTPCTTSMISSFTPCLNFITGSSGNGSSPTADCCNTLQSLASTSLDCACLIVNGNVPFQLPIVRSLAISLPRACNTAGLPIQCKASGTPLPAPGPALLGPTPPPFASAPFAPRASKAASLAPVPESGTPLELTPASSPVGSIAPTANPRIRPVLTPSASDPPYISLPSIVLIFAGTMVFMCF